MTLVEQVMETTHAGSGCTSCRGTIDGILTKFAEAAMPAVELTPEEAEVKRRAVKICSCKEVDRGAIEDVIRAKSLTTVDEVTAETEAGSGCTGCCEDIDDILSELVAPIAIAAE